MSTYIAGPMSGLPDFNYPAFAAAAKMLRAKGVDVRAPHEIDDGGIQMAWEWYMRRALAMLLECDAVLLLPGWRYSRGAKIERQLALQLGMDVSELVPA